MRQLLGALHRLDKRQLRLPRISVNGIVRVYRVIW